MAGFELDNAPEPVGADSSWSSPTNLSRKVRELANRSYHALNSGPQPVAQAQARTKDVLEDLRDQIAWLQHKIHARKLGSLILWVDALGGQVDNLLGLAGKAEQ
jgi:hypothetical protein